MKKAIVLAAGLGKRMGGKLPKVLYSIRNKPLIKILLSSVSSYFDEIIIVLGFKGELVKATLNSEYDNLSYVVQKKQLGTADAVKSALLYINDDDDIFILNGDVPLLTMDSLKGMYEFHLFNSGVLTIGIIRIDDPTGYGRIIMDNEEIVKIVEEKDATEKEKSIDKMKRARK
jgi:bifunctional UDP-N-acetylglucosamine pyrophosphorylase/glucosamine-1-phosphate N-acetyltransferase